MPPWPFYSWAHWSMTEVTEERDRRMGHPIHLIMKILLCWGHHLVNIHMGHISSWFLPILRGLSTYLFHRPFCHQFSIMFFSMSLTIRPNHWLQPTDQCIITHMAISPSKPSEQPCSLLEVLHWEDFPSPQLFRVVPEKGCSAAPVHFSVMAAYPTEYNRLLLSGKGC